MYIEVLPQLSTNQNRGHSRVMLEFGIKSVLHFGWLLEMSQTVTLTFLKLYKIAHTGMMKGVEIYIQSSLFFSMQHPDTRSLFIATKAMSLRGNQVAQI